MDLDQYKVLTKKKPLKKVPRAKPLPKATQKYLEAQEELERILDILEIKFEKCFHFKSTKHWRFDFHLIEHRILIEIAGGPWSGGRKGKLSNKTWSMDRYDYAEELGYTFERFHPDSILSGYVINWIKKELERMNDRTVQTIPAAGSD